MKYFFTFFLLLTAGFAFSQDDDGDDLPETDSNVEKYLNDGVRHDARNFFCLSLGTLPSGYLDFEYERKLTKQFSVHGGALIGLFHGLDRWEGVGFLDVPEYLDREEDWSGFGYSAGFRYYAANRAITDRFYQGLTVRNRTESYETFRYARTDFVLTASYKKILKSNIGLEWGYGYGPRLYTFYNKDTKEKSNQLGLVILVSFKPGYFF